MHRSASSSDARSESSTSPDGSAAQVLAAHDMPNRRELLMIDIRPLTERREMGFIPASLSLPVEDSFAAGKLSELGSLGGTQAIVLYCASGQRSERALSAFGPRTSISLVHLEGGLRAWDLAGLPVCRVPERAVEHPTDVLAFRRQLVACFVGENTEVALDHQTEADPFEMLQECFRRASVPWDEPTIEGLYRVLDWAAVATFRAGGDLKHIADNLALMYGALQALEHSLARMRV